MSDGLKAILESIKVKNLVISKQKEECQNYKEIKEIAMKKHINIVIAFAGKKIVFDKYCYMDIIYPDEKLKLNDINNNSIVSKFVCKDIKVLFTGDIEKEAEEEILKKYNSKILKSDILKIAHHGSKTSTTDEFLNAVSPKIALIGVRKK